MVPLRQKHSEMVGIVRSRILIPKYLVVYDTVHGFVMVFLNLGYLEVETILSQLPHSNDPWTYS